MADNIIPTTRKRKRRTEVPRLKDLVMMTLSQNIDRVSSLHGLPPEDIEEIFQLTFRRPSRSTTRDDGATNWSPNFISRIRAFLSPGLLTNLDLSFMTKADLSDSPSTFAVLIQLLSLTKFNTMHLPSFWDDNMMVQLTSQVQCPTTLILSGCTWLGERAMQTISQKWSLLAVLEAQKCFAAAPTHALEETIGRRCSALRVVDLSGCGYPCVNDGFIDVLVKAAIGLEELRLKGCWRLTEDAIYSISHHAEERVKKGQAQACLRLLDIGDIDHLSAFALCSLKACIRLEELICCWTKEDIRPRSTPSFDIVLARLGGACPNLRQVDLRGRMDAAEVVDSMRLKYDVEVVTRKEEEEGVGGGKATSGLRQEDLLSPSRNTAKQIVN